MPPETAANLTPEQRLNALFEQGGVGAIDGTTDLDERIPDTEAQGRRQPTRAKPPESETPAEEETQGAAAPDTEETDDLKPWESEDDPNEDKSASGAGDEAAEGDDTEGSQEPEGIEAEVLAQVLGIEDAGIAVDEEGRPLFAVKVDGEDRTVPLPELLRGYSGQEVFSRKSQELAQERQEFQQLKQQELQNLTLRAQAVDQILKDQQEEVLAQYGNEDWDALRKNKPEEFAARRTEYAELYQKLEQRRLGVQQQVVDVHQRAQHEALQKRNEIAVEEGRKLRAAVKEWDTDEKVATGAKALSDFMMTTYGFTAQDLDNTLDHRAYLVALDAMRWRLQQQQVEPTRKRVVKAPRVMKPGTPSTEGDRRRVRTARVVKRHKQEQSVDSAAEALLARNIV